MESNQYSDPIERLVTESGRHLATINPGFQSSELEAEAIYLAAYLVLKDDYRIDFKLDYLAQELLDSIPSENYQLADKVFQFMTKHFPDRYGAAEMNHGMQGYKMN